MTVPKEPEGDLVPQESAGHVTTTCWLAAAGTGIGLGYVRREISHEGAVCDTEFGPARIIAPPRRGGDEDRAQQDGLKY